MSQRKTSMRKRALIWAAVGTPGVLAFMANTSDKEAASNLASWLELVGLPVPDFLNNVGIDEQVTQAVLAFYGLLATVAGLGILKKSQATTHPVTR